MSAIQQLIASYSGTVVSGPQLVRPMLLSRTGRHMQQQTVLGTAGLAAGTYVVSENTTRNYAGVTDTKLRAGTSATTNFGTSTAIAFDDYGRDGSDTEHLLIKFNLSSIPAGTTISAAKISLNATTMDMFSDEAPDMRQVARAWVDSQATWNIYSTGNSWATAGAFGTGDIAGSNVNTATFGFNTTGYQDYGVGSGFIALVQGWISGSIANNGVIIQSTSTASGKYNVIVSSEGADGSRPKLTFVV